VPGRIETGKVPAPAAGSQTENFYENMEDSPAPPSQAERLVIIERLMDRGMFLLKGSVTSVAQKLRCSESSLYRIYKYDRQETGKGL
jgi:predicted transcriptional regulator YheO